MNFHFKPMLAMNYIPAVHTDVFGWQMSEKLNGIRAVWDGESFYSKNGNPFAVPAWYMAQMPEGVVLDGELWMGRNMLQKTASVVRKHSPVDHGWRAVAFRVFDAPQNPLGFEDRLIYCARILEDCPVAGVVHHVTCMGHRHLMDYFDALVAGGAEGAVLRAPGSPYVQGESEMMLKLKPFKDAEAIVLEVIPGTGRNADRLGSMVVQWGEIIFKLSAGFSCAERTCPPAPGSVITFQYSGLSDAGVPLCASYVEMRDYE